MHLVDANQAAAPTLDAAIETLAAEPAAEAAPAPTKNNVVKAHFGRLSVADQLRSIADTVEATGDDGLLDYMCVVFASDDPSKGSSVKIGGNKDAHPFFFAGMLQNAALVGLDEAAALAFEAEEGMHDD